MKFWNILVIILLLVGCDNAVQPSAPVPDIGIQVELKGFYNRDNNCFYLSWEENYTDEDGFRLYESKDDDWHFEYKFETKFPNETEVQVVCDRGRVYWYKVCGFKSNMEYKFSNIIQLESR